MNLRKYQVGNSEILLVFGDITSAKTEVLVSSDDYMLSMGGGVSAAIRRAGGLRVSTDATKMVPARTGEVIVSTAGDLPAKYVLHAITLGPERGELPAGAVVRQTTQRVMSLLPVLGCRSVAFPAIGAGVAGIPYETVASEMAAVLASALLDTSESYHVELYLLDRFGGMSPGDFFMFFEQFAARSMGLKTVADASECSLRPPQADSTMMNPSRRAEAERRHQVYTMLRHLDARRNQFEASLVDALGSTEGEADTVLPQLRKQLDEIQTLRRSYESQLTNSGTAHVEAAPNSIFVSSTSADLKPHRQVVRDVIGRLRLQFVGMEEFAPTAQAPVDLIRRKVAESQVYFGILGMRYGHVDAGTGLSMTELEYRQAIACDRRICMFVMDESAQITAKMVETDPTGYAKLIDFKKRVLKAHTCAMFMDPTDLATKAEATLKQRA